jgi:polysaccharide export outer membrane protein
MTTAPVRWIVLAALAVSGCAVGVRPAARTVAAAGHGVAALQPDPLDQARTPGVPGPPSAPGAADGTRPSVAALNSALQSRFTAPAREGDLPVGVGDLIEVSVFEVEELSKLKLRIPRRGTVNLPLLGAVPAAGRTPVELEEDIRARLQTRYMHDPQVSVFVHEQASQRVSIIGAVRKGGVQTVTGRLRLADALALAEGLTEDADHVVYVIRRVPKGTVARAQAGAVPERARPTPEAAETEEVMVPVDLEALVGGRDELNIALEPGDVVNVPRAGSYYVGGSVMKPGSFLLRRKTTVEQAVLAAGGAHDVADLEDVRVYRERPGGEREVLAFNLKEFEREGRPGPELSKNDVVIVGKSQGKAFWFGFLDFFKGVFGLSKGI